MFVWIEICERIRSEKVLVLDFIGRKKNEKIYLKEFCEKESFVCCSYGSNKLVINKGRNVLCI